MTDNHILPLFVIITLLLSTPVLSAQTRNSFTGSVPTGQQTGATLDLSISDAIDRALKYNLGVIESGETERSARAVRLRNLNALLPNLTARLNASLEQIDLKAQGFGLTIPGVRIPTIVGPFAVQDVRAYVSQDVFNWSSIKNWKE